ncbi:MAG TPA: hypothetical protein VJB59_03045 [Bdellovibrionota bacterium]|nr:hypothetical protein [Bdellovibrionota bacterium]
MEMKKKESGGVKIGISEEAEKGLEAMVAKTNEGFSGGRVSKQDMASWIIRYFEREAFSRCMEMVREDHFDQVAHLEAVLRRAKEARRSGVQKDELAKILDSALVFCGSKSSTKRLKKMEASEGSD